MINSRKIEDLHPEVARRVRAFKALCEVVGIDLLITSTYRDAESQDSVCARPYGKWGQGDERESRAVVP